MINRGLGADLQIPATTTSTAATGHQADAFDTFTTEIGDWFVINQFTVREHTEIRTVRNVKDPEGYTWGFMCAIPLPQ